MTNLNKSPSISQHTRSSIVEELHAWYRLIITEWKWISMIIISIILFLLYTHPLPPRHVVLVVGQQDSTFDTIGQRFIPYFRAEGIELELRYTAGSAENLKQVSDINDVNAALLVGGLARKGDYPRLASLGSIEFTPLWVFYRGDEYRGKEGFTYFSNKRIAIGKEGSGTHIILKKILELRGLFLDDRKNFLNIPHHEAMERLLKGDIDAMCILDGIDSPTVRELLAHKEIHIYSFIYAPAYEKKLPFLETVVIPKGSLDLKTLHPENDIQMLASTVTLLVEKDLHPAIQQLFLMATEKISREQDQFFARPDFFPAYMDHTIELSPVARRFYDSGPPPMKGLLPHWLTSYLDRIWFLILGGIAIIYPLFKLFPSYRRVHSVMLISDGFEQIKEIEKKAVQARTVDELKSLLDELNEMDIETCDNWISTDEIHKLYAMKSALNLIRQKIALQINNLER